MAESDVQNGGGAEKTLSFKAFKPELLVEAPKASDAVVFYKAAFGAEEVNRTLHRNARLSKKLLLSSPPSSVFPLSRSLSLMFSAIALLRESRFLPHSFSFRLCAYFVEWNSECILHGFVTFCSFFAL